MLSIFLLFTTFLWVSALTSVHFGSCNRQNKPQSHWDSMSRLGESEMFLWTGDSVYAKNHTLDGLETAYGQLMGSESYRSFVDGTKQKLVDGVWDDHDLGVNDAGVLADREARAGLYTNFLKDSSHGSIGDWAQNIRKRKGVYHVRDIDARGTGEGDKGAFMKVIFLDTRYARAPHYIRSLGEINFPLMALVAAAIRTASSFLGLGMTYGGAVLGETQWKWLEDTLSESVANGDADYHVIVSSIQVLTTNPAVESWGHFPMERIRLLNLIAKHNPKGVVLLSGDVHHGEVGSVGVYEDVLPSTKEEEVKDEKSEEGGECVTGDKQCSASASASASGGINSGDADACSSDGGGGFKKQFLSGVAKLQQRVKDTSTATSTSTVLTDRVEQGRLYEVTSSGLTHTCGDNLLTGILCPLMLRTYTRHRRSARNTYDGYYIGTNFGSLLFDKDSLEVSVRALPDGHAVLHRTIYPERIHVDSEHGPGLLIRPRDFFRFHRDGPTILRIMVYAVLQYLVYKWLKWAIHGVRIRLCPKWGKKDDDDDADGEGDSDGDEERRGKNKRNKKLRPRTKIVQPTGSVTRRDPLDLADTAGDDSEEEEEVANLPNDPEGEFQYWKRRFYEGKDTPNEVSEVLEKTTSDRGVTTTKKMTVSDPKKKTMNVEYIFEIPEELNVETSQPGVPPSSTSTSTSTSASHTSYAVKDDNDDDSEVEKESLLPESMRMFFAVSLPESVKSVIEESTRSARNTDDNNNVDDSGDVPMKWSSKNGYHVTVRFIGEVKRADLPAMVKRLQKELSELPFSYFDMALKGCGSFPHGGRPRILWAGLDDACVPFLKALRSAADAAISGQDSSKQGAEGKKEEEMNAHVTVARCNANRSDPKKTPAAAAHFLAENAQLQTPVWSVASLDLYLSESSSSSSPSSSSAVEEYAGRAGSVYTVYRSFPLP